MKESMLPDSVKRLITHGAHKYICTKFPNAMDVPHTESFITGAELGYKLANEETQWESAKQDELIMALFEQSCGTGNQYDHRCLSTYEHAQDYLIQKGLVKENECRRK